MVIAIADPIVREGDARRVPTDVVEDLLGSSDRTFDVDDPVDLPHRREIPRPCVGIAERAERAGDVQPTGVECGVKLLEKQSPEEA